MSLKDKILSHSDHRRQELHVPEWDCVIYLRTWTAGERSKMIDVMRRMDAGKATSQEFYAKVLTCSIVDEAGEAVFCEKDIPELLKKNSQVIDNIIKAANELNTVSMEVEKKD